MGERLLHLLGIDFLREECVRAMEIFESHGVLIGILTAFLGVISAFLSSYFKFINEFNYIKGQLSQLLEVHEDFKEVVEKHARIELDFNKVSKDVDRAFVRIKMLETDFLKRGGTIHGSSS